MDAPEFLRYNVFKKVIIASTKRPKKLTVYSERKHWFVVRNLRENIEI